MSTRTDSETTKWLKIAKEKTGRLEVINEWISEWCSSILVKESRQALKSKQFIWTYFLLLICVGIWALYGIASGGDEFRSGSGSGRELLQGFLVILGFPLGLIIPFSAYRSLTREFEDGTIQLISITTLNPWQIIAGKLGSAILQMLVYLSVLAPCILFTYLLRGVSLPQILFCLAIGIGSSICLIVLGLFLAGIVRSRAVGVGVSVLFVLFLGWLYCMWCVLVGEMLRSSISFDANDETLVLVMFGFVAFFASLAGMMLVTAASQISFPSNNRSTLIRLMMIVQQTLFFAWAVVAVPVVSHDQGFYLALMAISSVYWLFMGFMMIGESPEMSRRVQRSLPVSFVSRSVFSLVMPGPGRGFLFAMAMIVSCAIGLGLMIVFQGNLISNGDIAAFFSWQGQSPWGPSGMSRLVVAIGACCVYPLVFLSVTFLLVNFLCHRKKRLLAGGAGPVVGLLMGIGVVVLPMIGSWVWHLASAGGSRSRYSYILVFNWPATVREFATSTNSGLFAVWFLLWTAVMSVFVLAAVVIAARELRCRPISIPRRVLVDDREPDVVLPPGESIEEIFGKIDP